MKFVVLAILVAAVTSSRLNSNEEEDRWPWQVGKLYRYDVDSHTLARLQEGPSTGFAFKTHFLVRVKAPGLLQVKLENPQHAQVHEELPKDWTLPKHLEYKLLQSLTKPFEISVVGGRVKSMRLPSSLYRGEENFLKGLVGSLQVDLSTHRSVNNHNTYDKESYQGQFKKMETDVTGDCETLYTVSPVASEWRRELPNFSLKEDPIEITKSKTYGHCHHRVEFHFGVPKGAEWAGTAQKTTEQQFIDRATTSRILAGRQGPIFKSETTNNVNTHPHLYGKQKAEIHSHVKFILVSYEDDKESEWQLEDSNEIPNLLYSMTNKRTNDDNSDSGEQARRERRSTRPSRIVTINKIIINKRSEEEDSSASDSDEDSSEFNNFEIPDNKQVGYPPMYLTENPMRAQKLVQELAQTLQNPNNMPKNEFLSKFNILVHLINSMSYEQLLQTSRSLESAKSSTNNIKADMWMIYRDAVAQSGTMPAYQQIQLWILKKKIQGEEAAEVVASMAKMLSFPTKEQMIQFFKLAMNPVVREQKYLNDTVLIAATKFINMGYVNEESARRYYPIYTYGRFARRNDDFINEDILPRLRQELEQAIQEEDSHKAQVFVKALGNLGHRGILEVLAPYLEGKIHVSTYLRARMVDSLAFLAHQRDQYVRSALYSILRNTAEHYEVRVAAAQVIFLARPTSGMMQAMAQMTNDDPSVQVRAVLKSAIEEIAQIKNPRYWEIKRAAQEVVPMLTKEALDISYSARTYADSYENEHEQNILRKMSYTGSKDSLYPKAFEFSFRNKNSVWNWISASVSSVQDLLDYYKEEQWKQEGHQNPRPEEPNHKFTAEKILAMLNMEKDNRRPLEAALNINLMNQERYFAFAEHDLRKLPLIMKQYLSDLPKGIEKHYTKVLNQQKVAIMFPVAIGMPFIYKYKEPTVVHIQSKSKGEIKLTNEECKTDLESEIHFTYARNLDGSVGFMDTLTNNFPSVGVISKIQFHVPLKVESKMQENEVKIHMQVLQPEQDSTILHYSVWPYSAQQKYDTVVPVSMDKSSIVVSRDYKVANTDIKIGQSVGSVFQLQGYSYSSDYKSLDSMFRSKDLIANIASLLNQKDVALTHYNIKYLGKQSPNKRLTLTIAYDTYYNQKQPERDVAVTDMQDVSPNSQARREEIVKRASAGIDTAKSSVLDLSASFDGPQKVEYVWTGAMSRSPVDYKMRYAFFAAKNSPQSGSEQINGYGTITKPEITAINFMDVLKKELKMTYDAEIKFGKNNGNIRIQGYSERSQKYTDALKESPFVKSCDEEISRNLYYQPRCHKSLVAAQSPDYFKASVTYKDVSPAFKYMAYRTYRIAEHFGFWYAEINPLKTTQDGKLDIEMQMNYLDKYMKMSLNSRYGEVHFKNVPITKMALGVLSMYNVPFTTTERVKNMYSNHLYQPYCAVEPNRVRTFSNRTYDYDMRSAWHVVVHQMDRKEQPLTYPKDQLLVLARKPEQNQLEIYISYRSRTGKDMEIEIHSSPKPQVKVNTQAKKISAGPLTMYWDDVEDKPLLQYYTRPDGVLMLNIREDMFRAAYDSQRMIVLGNNRNNNRGLCGHMSGDARDDYMTPKGLVDQPDHYGASYSLQEEHSDPKINELKKEAEEVAYERKHKHTTILRTDDEWLNADKSTSSEETDDHVYRVHNFMESTKQCELKKQVQYYENHGEICISTMPIDSCNRRCRGEGYKTRPAQMVCRPKMDRQFVEYRDQIRQGENPEVQGVGQIKQFRVPTYCRA